jgi:hypothetical protein
VKVDRTAISVPARARPLAAWCAGASTALVLVACAPRAAESHFRDTSGEGGADAGPSGGDGGSAGAGPTGGAGGGLITFGDASFSDGSDYPPMGEIPPVTPCTGPCRDFPAEPILYGDNGMPPPPASVRTLFGSPDSGAAGDGPCILEPEPDSLFPRNWLRPRIHFRPTGNEDLFEIRIHGDREENDLVAFTQSTSFYLPKDLWDALCSHVAEEWPMSVTVRGIDSKNPRAMPTVGAEVKFTIAPSTATGSIVYWTTTGGSALKGFSIGDENVVGVLTPALAGGKCIGCHTSTPDGNFVGVSVTDDPGTGDPARIEIRRGKPPSDEPSFISAAAKTLLARPYQHIPTFSKAHWRDGDHIMLSMFRGDGFRDTEIIWTNLEAPVADEGVGWGTIARTGDARAAGGAIWSHDGKNIAYCSAPSVGSGANEDRSGDIYTVPYADGRGGSAAKVLGASDPLYNEFYANWSADDRLLAFTRTPDQEQSYDDRLAEVYVVPAAGGASVRLLANDPPACAQEKSPGIGNAYPKWSPRAQTFGNKTYYWLVLSSRRSEGGNPQLYATGIVDNGGKLETHGALYLWNQPADEGNHTPAWDAFVIPETPPPAIVH